MQKQVNVTSVVAYSTWVVGFGLWVVSWIVGSDNLGRLSLIVVIAAATGTVRIQFTEHQRAMKNALIVLNGASGERPVRPVR